MSWNFIEYSYDRDRKTGDEHEVFLYERRASGFGGDTITQARRERLNGAVILDTRYNTEGSIH